MTLTELTVIDKSMEDVWTMWLNSLDAWERHYIFKNELQLHDDFMAGEIGWADLSEMLKTAHREVA